MCVSHHLIFPTLRYCRLEWERTHPVKRVGFIGGVQSVDKKANVVLKFKNQKKNWISFSDLFSPSLDKLENKSPMGEQVG